MTTRQGELHASFGVMGGFMQPHGHLQMLVNMVDLDMSPQQALDVPRWRLALDGREGVGADDPGGLLYVEEGWPFDVMAALAQRGHHLAPISGFARGVFDGEQTIVRDPETGVLTAGSDPRRTAVRSGTSPGVSAGSGVLRLGSRGGTSSWQSRQAGPGP